MRHWNESALNAHSESLKLVLNFLTLKWFSNSLLNNTKFSGAFSGSFLNVHAWQLEDYWRNLELKWVFNFNKLHMEWGAMVITWRPVFIWLNKKRNISLICSIFNEKLDIFIPREKYDASARSLKLQWCFKRYCHSYKMT